MIAGTSLHRHFEGTTCRSGLEIGVPPPQGISVDGCSLVAERDDYLFPGVCSAPHMHGHFTLYDHVVGKDFGDCHLSGSKRDRQERKQEQGSPVQWKLQEKSACPGSFNAPRIDLYPE